MSSCFISDLHLDNKREDIKKAFFKFLESEASEFENLYILGDLFEVWIGDDFEDRFTSEVISELKKFSLKNKNIFIMHGNRDFLIGKKFAEKCGAKLVSDPLILNDNVVFAFTVRPVFESAKISPVDPEMPVKAKATLPPSEAVRCTPSVLIFAIPSKPAPLLN